MLAFVYAIVRPTQFSFSGWRDESRNKCISMVFPFYTHAVCLCLCTGWSTYSISLLQVGDMKLPVYHSQEIQPVFVHPVPGYGGHLEVLLTFFPLSQITCM